MLPYADSYYARSRDDDHIHPPLDGSIETEVCVVGGGMAGLAAALGLAERGRSVILLEAHRVGWGASGRNGGFVSAGYSRDLSALIARVGRDRAVELHRLSQEAVDLVRRRAQTMGQAVAPITDGLVRCSWFDDRAALDRRVAQANELVDADLEVWPREKVRAIWRSPRYFDAVMNPKAFTFHSLNFARGTAKAAIRAGAVIHEATPVTRIDLSADRKRVETATGTVLADQVVVACSGYIDGLVGPLSRATLPIGTYVVLTEPVGGRLAEVIGAPHGVSDDRFASDYYRPLPDTRILWGGRISRWTDLPRLAETMMADLRRVYPQLADVRAEVAWPGTMGYATHKMMQVGQLAPGVWYNQGHGGHGMATTTLGGELIASAIAEGDERWRLFEPFGLSYAGGVLGPWVAQAVYWSYQARDAWKSWRQTHRV
ncbi:MAG: FAD-binding oxidoreductase [Alphaproteobacteria bacterium]|nr:FAD-binding oxidoreductase [Alphaproteobacteria bacterium]